MPLQLKPKTTYTDGNGRRVCIAGPAKYEIGGVPAYWSIGGDHYTEAGLFIFSRQAPGTKREDLILERFTRPESLKNVTAEDTTEAARKWWVGVEV